ncbi:MAG: collagen-binding domain-containing protein [Verrucomicrobiia bacterium]
MPSNLVIYGLPGCTSITLSGNSDWNSCVYAPQAALTMSGNKQTYGSLVASNTTFSGNVNFHYDEALRNFGGSGYLVATWRELRFVGGVWQ